MGQRRLDIALSKVHRYPWTRLKMAEETHGSPLHLGPASMETSL